MANPLAVPALTSEPLAQTVPNLLNKAAPALINNAQTNPQLAQLKAQMADIIEPSSIGFWPLAWGWWVLITGVIILLAASLYWLHIRKQANAYRHHALAQLKRIRHFDNRHQQAKALMVLTKRVALTACPSERELINRLSGAAWLQWLNNHTKQPLFNDEVAEQWQANLYRPNNESADDALTERCKRWISQHRDTPITASNSRDHNDDTSAQGDITTTQALAAESKSTSATPANPEIPGANHV